jgi:hypothetical protein
VAAEPPRVHHAKSQALYEDGSFAFLKVLAVALTASSWSRTPATGLCDHITADDLAGPARRCPRPTT